MPTRSLWLPPQAFEFAMGSGVVLAARGAAGSAAVDKPYVWVFPPDIVGGITSTLNSTVRLDRRRHYTCTPLVPR